MTAEMALTAMSESAHGDLKSRRTPRTRMDLHASSMASARESSIPAKRSGASSGESGPRSMPNVEAASSPGEKANARSVRGRTMRREERTSFLMRSVSSGAADFSSIIKFPLFQVDIESILFDSPFCRLIPTKIFSKACCKEKKLIEFMAIYREGWCISFAEVFGAGEDQSDA